MNELVLMNCEMVVQPAGHARVKKEQRKNVHAFIKGELVDSWPSDLDTRISYSPYIDPFFFIVKTGDKIDRAAHVRFTSDGKCFIRQH
jgi:hypothetical protein